MLENQWFTQDKKRKIILDAQGLFGKLYLNMKKENIYTKITFHNFVAWLKTLPLVKQFDYRDTTHCAFAQFLLSLGCTNPSVGGVTYDFSYDGNKSENKNIPDDIRESINALGLPHRFFTVAQLLKVCKVRDEGGREAT